MKYAGLFWWEKDVRNMNNAGVEQAANHRMSLYKILE